MKKTTKQKLNKIKETITDLSLYLDGSIYILMLITLISASALLVYGTYDLLVNQSLFSFLYFLGGSISLVLHGATKWIMNGINKTPQQ